MVASLEQLSPFVRVAMDSVLETHWTVEERMIWDYELLYIMEGQLTITVEDDIYFGMPGDFFLFKPKQRHSIRLVNCDRIRQPHVHFDLHMLPDRHEVTVSFKMLQDMNAEELSWFREDELSRPPYAFPNHFRPRNPAPMERLLFELIREQETKPPFWELRIKSCLLDLLALLMRDHYWDRQMKPNEHTDMLMDIRNELEMQVNGIVKLDELSARYHISKFHLIHLFKQQFHITPIHYHQKLRMERAKNMIKYSTASLTAIADTLGYNNIQTFSRAFKAIEGKSPSEYRKS
jgi:AraC-like DNA-binding protein